MIQVPRALRILLVSSLLAGAAQAQADHVFVIDTSATQFTWSGTTDIGDIVENPPNFSLSGTTVLSLDTGGNPVGSGAFVGGDALVTPNIGGSIPNPFPFLPPLATFDLQDAHVQVTSPVFSVDAAGNFNTMVTLTFLQGTLLVTTSTGNSVLDLSGMQSAPAATSGNLVLSGPAYALNIPVSGVFPFTEPSSGISGSLTVNGSLVADHVWTPPVSSCPGQPNSVGPGAVLSATGTPSLGQADLVLSSTGLPANQFGVVFFGPNTVNQPFGNGTRCVGGTLVRLPLVNSGPTGQIVQPIVNSSLPLAAQFSVGQTTHFQHWYRDPAGGGAFFNLSNRISVTFTP